MFDPVDPPEKSASPGSADKTPYVAGGSFGVFWSLVSELFPDGSFGELFFQTSCSAIAVAIPVFWTVALRKLDERSERRRFRKHLHRCRDTVQRLLQREDLTVERRRDLNAKLEKLDDLELDFDMQRLQAIKADKDYESVFAEISKAEQAMRAK